MLEPSEIFGDVVKHDSSDAAVRWNEERNRTLFDLGPLAVYSCDAAGVIQEFNRRAVELWGREPLVGDTDKRFCGSFKLFRPDGSFMPHEQCPMAEVLAGMLSEACDAEVVIQRPDGSRITVIVNIRPLRDEDGNIIGALNCFYDITASKETEKALRDSDRRKNEFLAILAHELRNPLAPICNALEVMRRVRKADSVGPAASPAKHPLDAAMDVLDRQVGQMVRLVDDLLDAGRISRGKMVLRRERVELSSVICHAVESVRALSDSLQQELTVTLPQAPVYMNADPTRLAQIVGNLLNNACKFTDRGGRIWLTVEPCRGFRSRHGKSAKRTGTKHRHPCARYRARYSRRSAFTHIRHVYASRYGSGALSVGAGHRPDAGEDPDADARWYGGRDQCGSRAWQ